MTLNPHPRRRLAIALVLGSVALAATAVAWFHLSGPRGSVQTGPSHHRKATSEQAKAAVEAAVFQYETATPGRRLSPTRFLHVRKVECSDVNVPRFRGHRAFRCAISFKEPRTGFDAACYALVGEALYEVGGCFPPPRDMGAGKSRLLTRQPAWVAEAVTSMRKAFVGNPEPISVRYHQGRKTDTVTIRFDHSAICGGCTAPSNARRPRGRSASLSLDPRTHRMLGFSVDP